MYQFQHQAFVDTSRPVAFLIVRFNTVRSSKVSIYWEEYNAFSVAIGGDKIENVIWRIKHLQ